MRLECGESIALRLPRAKDAAAIARHANDRNVWLNLRDAMPHPYSLADAIEWLGSHLEQRPVLTFAIECEGEVVGAVGLIPAPTSSGVRPSSDIGSARRIGDVVSRPQR